MFKFNNNNIYSIKVIKLKNNRYLQLCNLTFINYIDALKYCLKYELSDTLISTKKLYWYKILTENSFPKYYSKLDLGSNIVAYNNLLPEYKVKQYNLQRIILKY